MSQDPAKTRWMIIQLVRWSGVGVFMLGLMIYAGKVDLPALAGYFFIVVGLLDAFFVPGLLIRKWKTPR